MTMAARFDLPPEIVERGLYAVVDAIHDRLPRGVRVALLSWLPECWSMLDDGAPRRPARGVRELEARVVEAGVRPEQAVDFVVEMLRFLGERCGTPLAEAMRRRIPELAEADQLAALRGAPPVCPAS